MANFLFVYRPNRDTYGKMSPDEMQRHMQKWQAWIAEGIQKGWMLNPGDGLHPDDSAAVRIDSSEESARRLVAVVFERQWWHPYPHVVGHQGDQRRGVLMDEGVDEPLQ